MKIGIHKIRKIAFAMVFSLLSCSVFAQLESTKIKDGSVSSGAEKAVPGALFELESTNKGMLTSRLTTAQRDAISAANLTDGLLIFNTTTGCFDYWSKAQSVWLSICGTPPPAVFDISTAQCNLVKANGVFKQGETLTLANYLTIPVTVTQPGTYTVSATTTNGYYFNTSGTFPNAGTYVLNLPGVGTPNNGYDVGNVGDAVEISLNGKDAACTPHIFVEKANVDFAISCAAINAEGSYFIGIPLNASNKLTVSVNVTNTGFWSMKTNTVNGYSFSATGTFTATGTQTIELLGTGTPTASGINNFNLSSNATTVAGASCSGIPVTVAPVGYTVNCANAIQNGTYMQDVTLVAGNTITLPINVTATGQTTITSTTANGISFTSGLVNLSTLGEQTVTLLGSGKPVSGGITDFIVSGTPGFTGTCTLKVTIAGQPVAYTTNCSGITTSGTYAPGIAMSGTNTMTVPVNVSYVGAYTINTNTVNGISFSASGTFATTGAQNVVMTATGTPLSGGSFTYAVTANSTNGGSACNKNISFVFRTMKVLGLGGGMYQPGSAGTAEASRAILASTANFGPTGTVQIQNIQIINGAYNEGTALRNLINTNNIDIIVLGYNHTPNAASIAVLNDFVKNKKGVLIHSQENNTGSTADLINAVCGSSVSVSGTGTTNTNPLLNVSDPILEGPFGNIKGLNAGADVNNSYYVTNVPANVTTLATQNGNASRIFSFRHNTLGYMYIGDSGWTAGTSSNTSTDTWPARITTTGIPQSKPYMGGVTVYNSIMYANTMAWAIKYAQENVNSSYMIP
ncbi:hypothetical protein FLA105534_00089 [Flavobacterium bizetiae]|uniref:Uncharacterized protein n=1 Tax=Flavobacterium bizetiae TaxID=2704140 RepID=A0A6J4G694_9FLAO|nr:hypothetical protein [Flavobacterium bizetiae]CAA9194320.1 hypothetical protein FLA105534_00089 [Flavobacterium bizetiae]CAD5346261.1 hypothetical protein FLA105534_00202 [Flavobacterium bizetiae]